MTIFDLNKDEQGDWFAFFNSKVDTASGETIFDEPEEGAAEFRIRGMSSFFEEQRKDRKKEYKMVLNTATRSMERSGYYLDLSFDEQKKENDDALDYAITGIKNAFAADETPLECTRENKLALSEIPVFNRFIWRVFELISNTGIAQKEATAKN